MTIVDNQDLLLNKRKQARRPVSISTGFSSSQSSPQLHGQSPSIVEKAAIKSHSNEKRLYHAGHSLDPDIERQMQMQEYENRVRELSALNNRPPTRNSLMNTNYSLDDPEEPQPQRQHAKKEKQTTEMTKAVRENSAVEKKEEERKKTAIEKKKSEEKAKDSDEDEEERERRKEEERKRKEKEKKKKEEERKRKEEEERRKKEEEEANTDEEEVKEEKKESKKGTNKHSNNQ